MSGWYLRLWMKSPRGCQATFMPLFLIYWVFIKLLIFKESNLIARQAALRWPLKLVQSPEIGAQQCRFVLHRLLHRSGAFRLLESRASSGRRNTRLAPLEGVHAECRGTRSAV
jgi:hypothetical protein